MLTYCYASNDVLVLANGVSKASSSIRYHISDDGYLFPRNAGDGRYRGGCSGSGAILTRWRRISRNETPAQCGGFVLCSFAGISSARLAGFEPATGGLEVRDGRLLLSVA